MSYRTWITNQDGINYQLLGNNECYQPLIEYLKNEGCEVCEENTFENFEITDLPQILMHLQEYLKEKNSVVKRIRGSSVFNFDHKLERKMEIQKLLDFYDNSYMNLIPKFYYNFQEDLEIKWLSDFSDLTFVIKTGSKLFISAY